MPDVTIVNLRSKTIHCKAKTEKLIDILLSGTDWMHACGKKGKCTTCTAKIVSGADQLGDFSEAEKRFIKLGRLRKGDRLSCQVVVRGDVTLKVPDEYKLPHLDYSE